MISPRMVAVLPMTMWNGISVAIYSNVLVSLMTRSMANSADLYPNRPDLIHDQNVQDYTALFTMCLFGAGEVVGGFLVGGIRDRFGNKVCVISLIILTIAAVAFVIAYNQKNKYDYGAYLMCLLWGLQDSGLNCFVQCIMGFEFESKVIPFCVFTFAQNGFIFVFNLVHIAIMDPDVSIKT